MRNLTFTGKSFGKVVTLQQVQKRTAKKLYENNETIFIQSSNFEPFGAWSQALDINKKDVDGSNSIDGGDTFEQRCNNFAYYNCTNAQTGRTITYYKTI